MRIPIRLYKRHDLDLIYLYKSKDFSLTKAMKLALYGFVHHEKFFIDVPVCDIDLQGVKNKPIFFNITLNETYDKDIIDFLKTMPSGYRNSLVKNVLRMYLNGACLLGYYEDSKKAKKDHRIKSNVSDSFETFDTFNWYEPSSHNNIPVNVISVPKNKKYKKKKKYSTANIPTSELPDAILNDKIYDEGYLKQFDNENEENSGNADVQKEEAKPVESNPVSMEISEENDGFDLWGSLEDMMEKAGY